MLIGVAGAMQTLAGQVRGACLAAAMLVADATGAAKVALDTQ